MIINHTTKIEGQLEIDHERGVIYFHANETGMSVLRICSLPKPIPPISADILGVQLDITGCQLASWNPGVINNLPAFPKNEASNADVSAVPGLRLLGNEPGLETPAQPEKRSTDDPVHPGGKVQGNDVGLPSRGEDVERPQPGTD